MKKFLGLLAVAGLVLATAPQPSAQALPAARPAAPAADHSADPNLIQVRGGHGGGGHFGGGGFRGGGHFGGGGFRGGHFGGGPRFYGGGPRFGGPRYYAPRRFYGYRPYYRPRYYGYGYVAPRRLVCHRVWTYYGPRRVCHWRRWI